MVGDASSSPTRPFDASLLFSNVARSLRRICCLTGSSAVRTHQPQVYSQLQGDYHRVVAVSPKADSGGEPPPSVIAAPFVLLGYPHAFSAYLILLSFRPRKVKMNSETLSLKIWGGS
jgi:hypothetical protein